MQNFHNVVEVLNFVLEPVVEVPRAHKTWVSSDILKVSGYTNQFKNLLSTRGRRESGPGAILRQFSAEEKCNGNVQFDVQETGDTPYKKHSTVQKNSVTKQVIRRRQSGYGISITSDSTAKMRCRQRKQLFIKRNKVCDFSLLLAFIGLILVVIDAELTALELISKYSTFSILLRSTCVLSTVILCASIVNYHRIEVKIALIDSGADDWRVALSTERMIKLGIELAVCAVCPFPGSGYIHWPYISPDDRKISQVKVPIDVVLSVPMFLRAYLLCRFMVLHSKQFQDAATRSIAALNRISMDFRFVIKTMMADHPLTVLVVFTVSYWICMSWMFTQCERYNKIENQNSDPEKYKAEHYYLNSLWFIMVTFMSIGYGDIVPGTYCGRMLAITTGIVGAGVSSALIAVISRKLELSRAEKHVNNFMADSKLTNQRKNAAASVLQQTWFIHKFQRLCNKGDELRLRHHQRKFLNAIYDFRKIKWDQRKLQEKGNSLLDVGKLHNEMHETLWEMHRTQDQFISQIEMLTQKIVELQATVLNQQQQQFPQLQPLKLHSISPSPTSCTSKTLKVPGSNLGDIPSESDSTIENSNESYTTSIGVQVPTLTPPPANIVQAPFTNLAPCSTVPNINCNGHGISGMLTHSGTTLVYSTHSTPNMKRSTQANMLVTPSNSQDLEAGEEMSVSSPLIAHEIV
uniref:Calmodulin-binding domain-containing protein n=1 Tax=Acrobeloides nanus TaxID=290746 RepID=A0A914DB36_9BILA